MRADGADGSSLERSSPPDLNGDLLADLLDVNLEVLEVAGKNTARSLNDDNASLDGDGDILRDLDRLTRLDDLHLWVSVKEEGESDSDSTKDEEDEGEKSIDGSNEEIWDRALD